MIFSSETDEKKVGFVHSGRCEIQIPKEDGSKTVLNILAKGDSFGILSLYAEDFPTQILATKNSEIIFFSAEQIAYFVNNYSQISSNLINFLANRIIFLNKKIATFSGNRVENRLAAFLLCESSRTGCSSFPFNRQKTAEEINAGRASVYRALDSLINEELIKLTDKQITILDREGLERISK
ncbi:MAG: Crp/Fnr family transcriptional regulator [Clostridia bacterium]|nr:Crp/Fnr family transcriptional regulator [Clostridia bacterium]